MEDTKPVVYVDLRRSEEYVTGRLPGSRNISIEENPTAVAEIIDLTKDHKVILYCYSSVRSEYVCSVLEVKHGVKVDSMPGGLMLYRGPLEE